MPAIKHSRQRDAILTFLRSRIDHPTADVVYTNVRTIFPNISLGTVYRNLSLLVELGEAIRVPCQDGSEHFDGNVSPHYHFQCTECGAVLDLMNISNNKFDLINDTASNGFDGTIEGHNLFFYGKCPVCAKKFQKNEKVS